MFNYQKICQELLKGLPQKQKEIILRRFGLKGGEKETLEAVGQDFAITRERVRQIEKVSLDQIKSKLANTEYQKIFKYFTHYLKKCGGLRKEKILLADLGGKKQQAQVYFLLAIGEKFEKFGEEKNFHSFWAINKNFSVLAKKIINSLYNKFEEIKKPLSLKEIRSLSDFKNPALVYYLEVSKKILQNSEGLYGLRNWPEINPRGVKDKSYLVFKKLGKPLHFTEVARQIEEARLQTVHNELIKDHRFVLVGRGIYALQEWGYIPGQVKDVITQILKEQGPLTQREILERVLRQRLVKENTVLLNLNNKRYFFKDAQGKYQIKEI